MVGELYGFFGDLSVGEDVLDFVHEISHHWNVCRPNVLAPIYCFILTLPSYIKKNENT